MEVVMLLFLLNAQGQTILEMRNPSKTYISLEECEEAAPSQKERLKVLFSAKAADAGGALSHRCKYR